MFPFLFLSQPNSPHSSSYLRFLKRICQKGTAVETCTRTLTAQRPGCSNTQSARLPCRISGVELLKEIGLYGGLRVSGVPTKAYLIHGNPIMPLVWAGAEMEDGGGEKARSSPPCLPQGGCARQRHKGGPHLPGLPPAGPSPDSCPGHESCCWTARPRPAHQTSVTASSPQRFGGKTPLHQQKSQRGVEGRLQRQGTHTHPKHTHAHA